MWYLALLAVGIAILFAWFFFKKVTPQPETSVVTDNKENYKAAISAVVNQAKIIAANNTSKSEPIQVEVSNPSVGESRKRSTVAAKTPKKTKKQ